MCKNVVGGSSICVPGVYVCKGTNTNCGCDFTSSVIATAAPVVTATTTTAPKTTSSTTSTNNLRLTTTTAPTTLATTAPPALKTAPPPTTMAPAPPAPSAGCGQSPTQPLFVWAEWPTLGGSSDWVAYYSKMLSFVKSNCGSFSVVKLVLRVTVPTIAGLWNVSPSSVFYSSFLSKLPSNVQVHIYPYLLDAASRSKWQTVSSNALPPLENVFLYASQWNALFPSLIKGIVVDLEEKAGFSTELTSITAYKAKYGVSTFGMAIGYDATGSAAAYPQVDQFYLEMYDFYVNNAPSLTLVQVSKTSTVSSFIDTLTKDVLAPYVSKYTDPRLVFMWSVQAKSGTNCIYPLANSCGLKDDFGLFSAPDFNSFLRSIAAKYPVFQGREHGIFQFSFLPPGWF